MIQSYNKSFLEFPVLYQKCHSSMKKNADLI